MELFTEPCLGFEVHVQVRLRRNCEYQVLLPAVDAATRSPPPVLQERRPSPSRAGDMAQDVTASAAHATNGTMGKMTSRHTAGQNRAGEALNGK